ncbi:rhodanese-like domain-containing protein [Paenibacillus sp. WLX1005]|uniref:rhodanese-like domain-containing protein n=1 Tax=Paenibacillus sp. WLX1005 TaxID=3243766 RepID=UPI0039843047
MARETQITTEELRQRIAAGDKLQLIDVREDEEVSQGMIEGAQHIPMGQIPTRLDEISSDTEVVLICRSGYRSERVREYLSENGYDNCLNMSGGMIDWVEGE